MQQVSQPQCLWVTAKEWDDVRLQAARKQVEEAIQKDSVHPFLVLNIDQLWRQSLRFCPKVLMKGPQRQLIALVLLCLLFSFVLFCTCAFVKRLMT